MRDRSQNDAVDKALMSRVAEGDHAAFRDLVIRHQNAVYALAYRFLGNAADAEEIAQDSFVRLYEAAPRYRPDAALFRTYLLRIATNLCINRKARAYRHREESRDPGEIDVAHARGASTDPAAQALREERAASVRNAVLALPSDQRIALILSRYEGFSYQEIAEATGKSVSAVTSSLWRARTSLRDTLAAWAANPEPDPQDPRPPPVRKQ